MAFYSYDEKDIIIPPQDELFMRIPKRKYWDILKSMRDLLKSMGINIDGYIPPKIFQPVGNGISVDWERFSTPLWTQSRKDEIFKKEKGIENYGINHYGILSMTAEDVREIPLNVEYSPNDNNISHTDIIMLLEGEEKTWARNALSDISEIIISVPENDNVHI